MSENYIIDDDTIIRIDTKTKNFETDVLKNTTLIKGEHQSERLTFCMNRFVENKDLLECDKIEIHYINVGSSNNSSQGIYTVTDATQTSTDEIQFSWLISRNVTLYSGIVRFVIKFTNVDDDNKITYLWSTNINKDLSVSDGLDCDDVVDEEYIDILARWEESIRKDIGKTITNLEKRISSIDSDVSDLMGLEEQCVVECDIIERNGELHIGNLSKTFDEIYEVWSGYDYENSRGRDIVVKARYRTEYNDMVYMDFKLNALREDICFEFVAHNLYDDGTTSLLIITLSTSNHQAIYRTTFATEEQLGTIDEALDGIIEIQNTLIGGESA